MSSSTSAAAQESGRKRGRDSGEPQEPSKWRTRRAQEAYSSRLLDALRLVRAGGGGAAAAARGREVRDAAYRALAVSARGRSQWSRAILSRRRRSALLRARRRLLPLLPRRAPSTSQEEAAVGGDGDKAKVLGRLVPGCRKLSLPALLAEVSDYIEALEMQVRAMSDLTRALAAAAPSAS